MDENENIQTEEPLQAEPAEQEPAEPAESPEPSESEPESQQTDAIEAKLAELTDNPGEGSDTTPKPGDTFGRKEDQSELKDQSPAPETVQGGAKKEQAPVDEDQLLSGVQNPRTRERFKTLLAERSQAIAASQHFLKTVQDAGFTEETFGTIIDWATKVNSSDRNQRLEALRMVDQIRSNLAKDLGEPTEGVDIFADDPDLRDAVENLEMTEEGALEILRARKMTREADAVRQAQQARANAQAQQERSLSVAKDAVMSALQGHRGEPDFHDKLTRLRTFLNQNGRIQQIAALPPAMWGQQIAMMYESLPSRRAPQPLTSRAIGRGAPASGGSDPRDALSAAIRNLGI